jgi:nitrogen regulatory protein PII
MTVDDLTPMTKIELVIPTGEVDAVTALMRSVGATGYTALGGVSGVGHHGAHGGRMLFNDHDALTLLITVVPPEHAATLVAGLRPVLAGGSGVMFVSDTAVSRPEYFR